MASSAGGSADTPTNRERPPRKGARPLLQIWRNRKGAAASAGAAEPPICNRGLAPFSVFPAQFAGVLGAVAVGAMVAPALAQQFPTRPIRIVIPFAPGGATDVVFRMMGPRLSEQFGQPVLIDNRPGGSAVIGMEQVARAAPDGYTLGVANLTFGLNPSLMPKLPYNTERDFAPVSLTAIVPLVLTVHPSLPVRSVKELIAFARKRPDTLNYSSSGIASATHMAAALFAHRAGIRMVHVPFTGGGPALSSALGGHVEVYVGSVPALVPHLKAGKLVALGITTASRDPALPDVPTIAESGLPGFEAREWQGIVAPAATPAAVLARLQQGFARTMRDPELKEKLAAAGATPVGSTSEEFAQFLRGEFAVWPAVVKGAGIRVE